MAVSLFSVGGPVIDISDDVSRWMELVSAVLVPVATLDALKHGFGTETIGTM